MRRGMDRRRRLIGAGIAGGGASADVLLTLQTTSVTPTTFDPALTLSGGAPTPEWDMGDGTELTGASISHTYASAGTKTVTLSPSALGAYVVGLNAGSDNLTGSLPSLANLPNLINVLIFGNSFSGPLPDFSNNVNLEILQAYTNSFSGPLPDFSNNVNLEILTLFNNQFSDIASGSLATPKLNNVQLQSNVMSQTVVDKIIDQIYTYRASYIAATPILNVGGTNAAPSGNYTDPSVTPGAGNSNSDWSWNGTGHDPLTGKAKIYDLVNDVRSETFNTWTVTFTA